MTAREWSVHIEVTHGLRDEESRQVLERVLEVLAPESAAGSAGAGMLDVQLSVEADSIVTAATQALRVFTNALRKAGSPRRYGIMAMDVETAEHLEARLRQPDPPMVGISELAQLLGVTKQRASQLAQRRDFPAPYQQLASGPIWRKGDLSRFMEEWSRRPGRPTKTPALAHR